MTVISNIISLETCNIKRDLRHEEENIMQRILKTEKPILLFAITETERND